MSGRDPEEIWDEGVVEGERRVARSVSGLLATGGVGGADVMLGILALTVTSGAVSLVAPEPVAHLAGSLTFGIGFVFIVIGRSELFTENFLVPISTLVAGKTSAPRVARLWAGTLVGNLVALIALAWVLTRAGLVPPETLEAAGKLAETFADRALGAAFLSAVLAGIAMTLMTWLVHAVDDEMAKVAIALLVGFVLAVPSLNHAVVSFGEMSFGILAGTGHAGWIDLVQNFPVAVAGNLAGGLGFVTLTRRVQVRGEPG